MPLNSVPATTTRAGARREADAARDGAPSTSSSGAASCRATPVSSRRWRTPASAGSSASCPRRASTSSSTSRRRTCGWRCRSWRGRGLPLLVHAELPAALEAPDPVGAIRARYATWLASRPPARRGRGDRAADRALPRVRRAHSRRPPRRGGRAAASSRAARAEGLPITAETCPHYLTFCAEEIPDGATLFKCAPPIRERAHRERCGRRSATATSISSRPITRRARRR